ncbi:MULTISPECIES: asparagine--tRNA ligase [Sphingobacterium]|jgi:asparaginyl-tRNA synthetase|uniref:Asparagine--tRNA ligase n=2 Tax=Sphingobacterium TaxID=28453 RepID=A0ABW5YSK8_9SPHI|nr:MULTISPECIES: asparagine--tRNA ligase [unclassified Sphingobacterium]MBB2952805.1 asparaginyl-tRNA synthetase [Sphingobacterium sp. JUb56]MCS3555523.1 asparaginyl-tRNA synthetase [Sphingobacterium sp. JUb21]NJI76057.1 asparagine--tRNA ligase [Sphingobacterium sp. B16(2022)]QQD14568.1 asparagine--tRNA ligase [Sphingobacterium sp. UDSM-2020]TCR02325.1 asparaginyl-tRNA synthetase [Sphingobacterium sp. JUb20]
MEHTRIKELLNATEFGHEVIVKGWVKTFRNNQFIAINDGSSIHNIQAVVDFENTPDALLKRITTGAALRVKGNLIESQGKGQKVEIKVNELTILGDSDAEKYPLQPKKHSLEFLREIAHLRFRTTTFNAVFKVRNALAFAVHKFFNDKDFVYMHTPIITGSDAEGAGEMFRVTSLDLNNIPRTENGDIDFKEDFFGKSTNLTVSGQLEGELAAMALGNIYTFGPTFRAENSNTTRHLAEFWMIEPEMAFYELEDNMDLAEDLLKYVIKYALDTCPEEIEFLKTRLLEEEKNKPAAERAELNLIDKLTFVLNNDFERVTYTEAIDILKRSKPNQKKQFKYLIDEWGADLQSEHERYLVEKHYKKPVILIDYPAEIKSFYMKQNDVDANGHKTVRAMDILFPGIGEMVGGSQREENLDKLLSRMAEVNIPAEEMEWFLDTRRYGSAPHSGFGLGFERLVLFVTGMTNIRDVIPFPRTPNNAEF